jgi:hypothetical protein
MALNTNKTSFAVFTLMAILMVVAVIAFVILSYFGVPIPVNIVVSGFITVTFLLWMLTW